jgi:hypothetical protein
MIITRAVAESTHAISPEFNILDTDRATARAEVCEYYSGHWFQEVRKLRLLIICCLTIDEARQVLIGLVQTWQEEDL